MKAAKIGVLVAGSWGTALASVLAENHDHVWLWSKNKAQVDEINQKHRNSRYFPEIELAHTIHASDMLTDVAMDADILVLVPPSTAMRTIMAELRPLIRPDTILVHATKGFELDTLKRMSTVIAEELPMYDPGRVAVISGPSHAEEVILKSPTTIVAACADGDVAEHVQDLFMNQYFRVYTNLDILGVEIAGALKNIIAIGAGLSDGLGYGDNAKAALLTRGMAEISRLGVELGANPMTFAGLAGIGDLVVTCTSSHSRNWRAGYHLGQGMPLHEVLNTMGMVVEGVNTTKSAYALSRKHEVTMPITNELYQVLFQDKAPRAAVEDLMGRGRRHEIEEIAKATQEKWF